MSRRSDGLTGELFAAIPRPAPSVPGSMDYRTQVAFLVSEMLAVAKARDPEMDRAMIAAKVSRLTGKDVSKAMLDGYTAESRESFNAPAYLMPALEVACDSTIYSDWNASVRGGRMVLGPAAIDAEIGRLQGDRSEIDDRLKELRQLRRSVR
ncbi:hypothetical protein ACFONC_11840 [Luteimonas soli]|uniref:Uncharacterized protein n=1 Tax=Luteimonas soli TaxID=1648966 RepID=A0ABV7XP94_9GAMM